MTTLDPQPGTSPEPDPSPHRSPDHSLNRSIVLASDDAELLDMMSAVLVQQGFTVRCARDGHTAVQLHTAARPSLIVLDWMMPGLTAVEACRRIRGRDRDLDTPILVLSATGAPRVEAAMAAGATECLHTPLVLHSLVERVRHHLDGPATEARRVGSTPPRSWLVPAGAEPAESGGGPSA